MTTSDAPDASGRRPAGRREFLTGTTGLAGLAWLAFNAPLLQAAAAAAERRQAAGAGWAQLDERQAATLAAAVDQIIPPDDLPGAAELGVVHFIDLALGGFMAGAADELREGLAELERRAHDAGAGEGGFAGLPFERQTQVMQAVEDLPFFSQLLFLTHCGMFAMPARGGNRDEGGWRLLGFDSRHAWQPPFGYYDAQAGAEAGNEDGAA